MDDLKLKCELIIEKNDEKVNEFNYENIKALKELNKVLSEILNKKNFYNIIKTKINYYKYSDDKRLEILIKYKHDYYNESVIFNYLYKFSGESLKEIYTC